MNKQPALFLVEDRLRYTESELRQAEINEHVAAFLRKGGTIVKLGTDATGYDRSGKQAETFVINHHILPRKTKKSKQNWKEHKHGKRTTGV